MGGGGGGQGERQGACVTSRAESQDVEARQL